MKIMINHQMLHQSTIFAGVLTTEIFPGSKHLQKFNNIRFSYAYFFNHEQLKRFIWKYYIFCA